MTKYSYEKWKAWAAKRGKDINKPRQRQHCWECNQIGHNIRTCPTLKGRATELQEALSAKHQGG